MLELLILRHAKSSWKNEGLSDHERPLNERGQRDAPRMGRVLSAGNLIPDRILSSDAVRARKTAILARDAAGCESPLLLLRELYLAAPATYVHYLSHLDAETRRPMVVGHNPGLEDLTHLLTGREETVPTACLVHIRLAVAAWSELPANPAGELVDIWRPKELGPEV